MKARSYSEAMLNARRNSKEWGEPWMAFFDTSGNARCEPDNPHALHNKDVFINGRKQRKRKGAL